jgi:hypothetical protein
MGDMPAYLVSVPLSVHVRVSAPSADEVTDEMVEAAALAEHGKYVTVDMRDAGYDRFEVLDELEDDSTEDDSTEDDSTEDDGTEDDGTEDGEVEA